MDLILFRSSSRNFPSDLEPELQKAGYTVISVNSLHAYIGSPARGRPQLLVLEVGNVADLDRALMVVEWNEHVQPLAPARYVLLMASKNLTLGDRAAKLGTSEIFALPQPMRNLLFKLELQGRLLKSAAPAPEIPLAGFTAKVEEVGPAHRRVLVVRGPPPKSGSWQDNGNTPSGKVRWRWVKNPAAAPGAGDEFKWTVESTAAPRFEGAVGAWVTDSEDDTVTCEHAGETIFTAPAPPPATNEDDEGGGRSEPFHPPAGNAAPGPQPPGPERRLSVDHREDAAAKFSSGPQSAPGEAPARIAGGSPPAPEPSSRLDRPEEGEAAEPILVSQDPAGKTDAVPSLAPKGAAAERARAAIEHARVTLQGKKARAPGAQQNESGEAISGRPAAEYPPLPESERRISLTTAATPAEEKNAASREPAPRPAEAADKRKAASRPTEQATPAERAPRETAPAESEPRGATPERDARRESRPSSEPARASGQEPAVEAEAPAKKTAPMEDGARTGSAEREKSSVGYPGPAQVPWGGRDSSPASSAPTSRPGGESEASAPGRAEKTVSTLGEETGAREDSFVTETAASERADPMRAAPGEKREEAPPLETASPRGSKPNSLANIREVLAESDLLAHPAILVTGSGAPAEDERRFLKTRHFELMTLEQLDDRDSSWHPMGGLRVYLSAQHRYYGIKDPKEVLPIWVYDGELAPEFIDEQRSWKFYDRLPIRIDALSGLPAGAFEALYKLCGLEPPEEETPHQRSRSVILIEPAKPESKRGAKIYLPKEEPEPEGGWKKIVRAVKSVFKK